MKQQLVSVVLKTLVATTMILISRVHSGPTVGVKQGPQCQATFYASDVKGTQAAGRAYCEEAGFGDLAAIQTADEYLVVTNFLATQLIPEKTAIYHTSGKYVDNRFFWLSINVSVGDPRAPYIPPYPPFPKIYPVDNESCLLLYTPGLSTEVTWRVDKCSKEMYFLCEYQAQGN